MILGKRNLVGALVFLVLIGEPAVGGASGFYSPIGAIALGTMYFLLFLLFEALVVHFSFGASQAILVSFALYSVLITGYFHQELLDFRKPDLIFVTSLIRIQSALVPPLVFVLVNRWFPRDPARTPGVVMPVCGLGFFFGVLSLTGQFGFHDMIHTFSKAPILSTVFGVLGLAALIRAFRAYSIPQSPEGSGSYRLALACLVLGVIPLAYSYAALLVVMPAGTAMLAWRSRFLRAAL